MNNTLSHEEREALKQEIFHSLHCALPGNVVSFDPDTQTASIQPAVKLGSVPYPVLTDVPVFMPVPFEINPGDACLVQLVRNRRSLRAEFAAEAFTVRRVCVCGVQGSRKSREQGIILVWSVGLLPIMSFPGTFCDLHLGEYGFEAGILRTACIYPEPDLSRAFPHMADTHLGIVFAVPGAFNTIIVFPAAEPVPHDFYIRGNCCSRPI